MDQDTGCLLVVVDYSTDCVRLDYWNLDIDILENIRDTIPVELDKIIALERKSINTENCNSSTA